MAQELIIIHILFIILSTYMVKSDSIVGNELTLRNQLFADIYLLKEGVDSLQISVEVLNKRYSNQIELLKAIQLNFHADDSDKDVCFKMGAFINSTNRKLNSVESNILTNIEQIQNEQTTLSKQIKLQGNSNNSCSSAENSSVIPNSMSPILSGINKKVDEFAQKLTNLEAMEEMIKSQQTKLEQYNQEQMKTLQAINAELTKNHKHFEMFETELQNIKKMITKMDRDVGKQPAKLPMALLLGLTTANLTKS